VLGPRVLVPFPDRAGSAPSRSSLAKRRRRTAGGLVEMAAAEGLF
jgi:hypothetical protein